MDLNNWKARYAFLENKGSTEEWKQFFEQTLEEYKAIWARDCSESFDELQILTGIIVSDVSAKSWLSYFLWFVKKSHNLRYRNMEDEINIARVESSQSLLRLMNSYRKELGENKPLPDLKEGMGYGVKKVLLTMGANEMFRDDILSLGLPGWLNDQNGPMIILDLISPGNMIKQYIQIAELARNNGLLSLDDKIDVFPQSMEYYLRMAVDGVPPEIIQTTLKSHFRLRNQKIDDLELVFINGLQGLMSGESPWVMEMLLSNPGDPMSCKLETDSNYSQIFVELAHIVKKKGLNALQKTVRSSDDPLLNVLLQILIQINIDLKQCKKMDQNYVSLLFDRIREEMDLAEKIISRGTLLIQEGVNPGLIKTELEAYVPTLTEVSDDVMDFTRRLNDDTSRKKWMQLALLFDFYTRLNGETKSLSEIFNVDNLKKNKKNYESLKMIWSLFIEEETTAIQSIQMKVNEIIEREKMKKVNSERIYDFECILKLDDRAIQKIMYEISSDELARALINTGSGIQDKFFRNLSVRGAALLKEGILSLGHIGRKDTEESQQKIGIIMSKLEEMGEIIII